MCGASSCPQCFPATVPVTVEAAWLAKVSAAAKAWSLLVHHLSSPIPHNFTGEESELVLALVELVDEPETANLHSRWERAVSAAEAEAAQAEAG